MTWANCTDVLQFRSGKMPWNRKSTVFLLTHKHLHIQINTKFSHIHPLSKYSHSSASQFILSDTHTVRPSSWGLLLPVHCWQTGSHHGAQAPQPSGCQDDDTSTSELRITLTSSSFLSLSSFQPSITSTPQLCITSYSLPPPLLLLALFICLNHLDFHPCNLSLTFLNLCQFLHGLTPPLMCYTENWLLVQTQQSFQCSQHAAFTSSGAPVQLQEMKMNRMNVLLLKSTLGWWHTVL